MRRAVCVSLTLALAGGVALAQPQFHDTPAGPRALPGDNLPPFGMIDDAGKIPPPPPLPPMTKGGPPAFAAPGPGLAAALPMARAAMRACEARHHRVGVAVVDSAGRVRAMIEADGSDGSHGFVAMRKAEAALAFAMPSSAVGAAVAARPALMAKVTPAMFVEGGALPIRRARVVIGAIGVSGAMGLPIGHADETCAAAGLKAVTRG